MAKAVAVVSALCFLALASIAHAQDFDLFTVEGDVYCDPCRVEFQTSLSQGIEGAVVELACRDRNDATNVTLQLQISTDANGHYNLAAPGDHEEEICEVSTISSPSKECNVPFDGADHKARVLLTQNNGVQGTSRYANALGFKTAKAAKECKAVLEEIGYIPEDA